MMRRRRKGRRDAPVVLAPRKPAQVPLRPGHVPLMFPRRWKLLLVPPPMPVGVCVPVLLPPPLVV